MAIDELIDRITGYRQTGSIDHRVMKHRLSSLKRPGAKTQACAICQNGEYRCMGDYQPFLGRVG